MKPLALVPAILLASTSPAFAGMPAPLPFDPVKVDGLGEAASMRFQAISFFLLVFLLSALALRLVWNHLSKDFTKLPRLSYCKALAITFLWGLLFVIVLTMISGARELMTPGAWQRKGATYVLAESPPASGQEPEAAVRRRHMEQLRMALWQHAATHAGKFPADGDQRLIATELWMVPGGGGVRYLYIPGLEAGHTSEILAYEPELDPRHRLVLHANGDISEMSSQELAAAKVAGRMP